MTVRSINALGSTETGIAYKDEAGVAQTGTATAGYTTLAAAIGAGSAGDTFIFTEAGDLFGGQSATSYNCDIYVADSAMHDWTTDVLNGVYRTGSFNFAHTGALVGIRISTNLLNGNANSIFNRCVVVSGAATDGFTNGGIYRNCVLYSVAETNWGYIGGVATNCISYKIHATGGGRGFTGLTSVENCISVGTWGDSFNSSPAAGNGNNLSADTTAPGTTTFKSIAASAIFINVGSGTEDAHWVDGDTADLYVGSDKSGDFILDGDLETRSSWHIGFDEVVSAAASTDRKVIRQAIRGYIRKAIRKAI